MKTLAGLPYLQIDFGKTGDHAAVDELCRGETTDLIVLSHGWKNDEGDAMALYASIVGNMLEVAGNAIGDRRFAVIGVTWPAFRFEPDLTLLPTDPMGGAGGAASLAEGDVSRKDLKAYALRVATYFDIDDAEAFAALAADAGGGGGSADRLVSQLRSLALTAQAQSDIVEEHALITDSVTGSDLADRFRAPPASIRTEIPETVSTTPAGAGFLPGLTEAVFRWRSGGRAAVARLLNQFTYFEMKVRAGAVGGALGALIENGVPSATRVHLIGHSFGARLVSSTAVSLRELRPASMTLLQGAFSHNGFGRQVGRGRIDGAFRRVIDEARITGAIAATHTRRDTAVGIFYPLASKVSGDIASQFEMAKLIGGPDDLHGGIGANGAISLGPDEAVAVVAQVGVSPTLLTGRINNVLADAIIADHNDVGNVEAARVVWAAINASQKREC